MRYSLWCNSQSGAPEDGRDHRPKHVELIGIINKPLLLHLFGVYIIYRKSVFFAESYDETTLMSRRLTLFSIKKEKLGFLAYYVQTTYWNNTELLI